MYFVACRSSTTSNFLVLCLCTRFPPGYFVLMINTPDMLIIDHVLMNKNMYDWIVRLNLVLNRTVVDSDGRFDNLCGSHLRRQSELYHFR